MEIEGQLQLVRQRLHLVVSFNPLLQALYLLHLRLGSFLIVPEARGLRAQLLFFHLHLLALDVQIAVQGLGAFLYVLQLLNGNHQPIYLSIFGVTLYILLLQRAKI